MRRSNARTSAVDSQAKMDPIKLQFRPSAPRSNFFSRISCANAKGNLWIFVLVAIITAFFCYIFVVTRGSRNSSVIRRKFGIIIDGGSTGTRIHVFEFVINEEGMPIFDFGKDKSASMKVNPGLSSFSAEPEGAGRSLLELLEFGRGIVPKAYWGETEIRLMATAGLRRLNADVQERILASCRRVLRSSGFKFLDDWASVISGSNEGIYAWVAANYALGTLGGDPQQTTGIIELGGASAQVTFVSKEPLPPEFLHMVKFGKFTYSLYSHSLLHFGQNAAYESLRKMLASRDWKLETLRKGLFIDPCTPKGYSIDARSSNLSPGSLAEKNKFLSTFYPQGNFSECRTAALMLLQKGKENCSDRHCRIGSTYIPKLHGKFLGTENFFYTSKFFGLPPTAYLSDLMVAGQKYCEEDWSRLKRKYHTYDEDDLLHYCFSSAYIVALVHDSLGIALDDKRIGFANQVGEIPLDWALGAFILQNSADQNAKKFEWIMTLIGHDSSTFLSLFIILTVLLCTAWYISKWRKPQLKTIYDLEKGRYIVTRVNR